MNKDKIEARIAGYAYAVRNPFPTSDYALDGECVLWWGSAPVPSEIENAWYQGIRDSRIPDEMDYCAPEDAASAKGVTTQTIYNILSSDERRQKVFPRAIHKGEGHASRWWIHFDDLSNWTPDKRGRKKQK